MYLEFDNFSYVTYVMYIFTRHGHRHDARDQIEYQWLFWNCRSLWSWITTDGNTTDNISKQSGLRSG